MQAVKLTTEASMVEVLASYERRGYTGQFGPAPDAMVRCHTCRTSSPAEQVPLLAAHRFEGTSDPAEEAVVMALECPHCGALGTMVLPYGAAASSDEGAVLVGLLDDRDQSDIRPGA